jgi:hypothetical protein
MARWYRDRGHTPPPGRAETEISDAHIARCYEALAFDLEVLTTRARQIRTLLPGIRRPAPAGRYSHAALRDCFARWGVPVEMYGYGAWHNEMPYGQTFVVVPTDGEGEGQTEELLLELCEALYPRRIFYVEFDNTPITAAGRLAAEWLAPPEG